MPSFSKAVAALGFVSVAMAGQAEHLLSSGMGAYQYNDGHYTPAVNSTAANAA